MRTNDRFSDEGILAQTEEMTINSQLMCPKEETLRQRQKYFQGVKFRSLEQLLKDARDMDFL